jgi:hypothetical protein|tara:strand:+ start:2430 stop:2678 length:249 start_codon:yes stop_codon:yes gene_type:complete
MTKQPTMDITQSINRHYPILKDLMTEEEFRSFLNEEGFEVSKLSLRDYRFRDKKFAYIKKGSHVYYPLHVNKQIIKEMRDGE